MDWARTHAIVTGGSSGIGLAAVHRFLDLGARVSVLALDDDDLERLRQSPRAGRVPLHLAAVDVTDRVAVRDAVAAAVATHGPCDLLLTSAGVVRPGYFLDLDDEEFRREVEVNYLGTLWPVRAVLPAMADRGAGSVVLISSFAGHVGIFGYGAYVPSKWAVRGLAEALRTEFARDGIHVACVYPTDVDTPMFAAEQPLQPPEAQALSGTVAPIPADDVVDAIVAAVERRRFDVFTDASSRALAGLAGTTPGLSRRIIDRIVARAGHR